MMTLAEIEAARDDAYARLRERRDLTRAQYETERRRIDQEAAVRRDQLVRAEPATESCLITT